MFSDTSLSDPALDKFNRLSFARRIGEVIVSRRDSSSLAIGIYGAWGEGKTTVFNFVERSLESSSNIICVRFNPLFFRDEEKLLLSFFKTLADALNRKLTTRAEDIGKWLAKCGEIISPLSLADSTGSVRGSGQLFQKIGNLFSQVELEENKKRIEEILEKENKKLVIFIDDIDRLDKSEIQSIFKLVKLSADFKNTIYLLAFDEEKVASAISEKYGSGDVEAGRSFLEKIIQVPLPLPQVSFSSLQRFCFECVEEALKNSDIELIEEDVRRFVKYFSEGLAIQLKTARVAQRYGNAITFSIPLLKGEVNVVDLLLIEGIKIFYPKLYNSIKEKSSYFLGEFLDRATNFEEVKKMTINVIDQGTSELSHEAQICAKNLLKELFPRLTGVLGNIHHGSNWQKKWTHQKRIASLRYFKRYFAYSISEDDISDQELIIFINQLEQGSVSNISDEIKRITNYQSLGVDAFLTEIFKQTDNLSSLASQNLALALAQIGDYFPRPTMLFTFESSFSRAGILISYLIQNVKSDESFKLAEKVLQTAKPIDFAIECFKWISNIKQNSKEEDSKELFSKSDIKSLAEIAVNRIRSIAQEEVIYLTLARSACELLNFWATWSSKEETNSYLRKLFEQEPDSAVDFLKCYIPTVWSMGMEAPYRIGLPSKGDLQRDTYNLITAVVDAELLIESFQKVYREKLNSLELGKQNDNQSIEELVVCQFVRVHNESVADGAG